MNASGQELRNLLTTRGTGLTGIPGRDFYYLSTSFCRFVEKQTEEFPPACITYGLTKESVLCHALYVKFFYIDLIKRSYILICHIMEKIFALIRYLLVCFSHLNTRFISAVRAFLLSAKVSLSFLKKFLGTHKIPGIIYCTTTGVHKKVLDANIYTYFIGTLRIFFKRCILTGEGNKPHTSGSPSYGYGLNIPFNSSREIELKGANTPYIQVSTIKSPSRLFEGKGVIPIPTLKPRKTGFTLTFFNPIKESLIGLIQSLENILEYLRAYSLKFRKGLFKFRQLLHLFIHRCRLPMLPVNADPLIKGKIIQCTADPKPLVAVGLCSLIYPGFIEICFSHFGLYYLDLC